MADLDLDDLIFSDTVTQSVTCEKGDEAQSSSAANVEEEEESESEGGSEGIEFDSSETESEKEEVPTNKYHRSLLIKRKAAGKPPLINRSKQQSDTSDEDYDFEGDLVPRKRAKVFERLPQKSTPIINLPLLQSKTRERKRLPMSR
ncbi:hypothetical protein L1987_64459 [Smallanthus sonchifolius]|uniref:Uncharacterized protein n=1 Tax=Smallanthus sonchifolius TaxID=185202 RepID=A0ACB9CG27_9ASTR|nr:hypothetical protein L1987_64459 [Smallanthus sonchifolius]